MAYTFVLEETKVAERSFGKKSIEYAKALKRRSEIKILFKELQSAYWDWLDLYEISKSIFGTEINEYSNDALLMMSVVKLYLNQYNEAKNFVEKWKLVEQKFSSVTSTRFKEILLIEKMINDKENEYNNNNIEQKKNKSFWKKIAPDTPLKFGLWMSTITFASIGVIYYIKKKS